MAIPWEGGAALGDDSAQVFKALEDERPRDAVPAEADVLVMIADTQDFGFWYVVRAFKAGRDLSSWLVRCGFCETEEALYRKGRDNHYWDCETGALAAADFLGLTFYDPEAEAAQEEEAQAPKKSTGWLNGSRGAKRRRW